MKGSLSTSILANLENRVIQLPKLAGDFAVASPDLPAKKARLSLSGNAGADLKKQSANVDLAMRLDESNIKAKFTVADFAALRSTFDIAIDKLNVDKYLPPKKPGETAKAPASPQPEQPIDFSPIKKLDVLGSVRIGDLTVSNIKAQNVRVDVRAKNGRLDVDPLAANLYQGSVKGLASIDANTNRIAVKQNLVGISIGPLLRDAAGQDLLEGRGNVVLDLTTTGNLVSAMKKTLNGSAKLELKDGAIKGINLANSLRNAKSMFTGGKRDAEQGAVAGEKTDFSELTASFDIKNGIAHNGDFLAKSPFLRLTGEGDINLPDSSLNYLAKAAVVASSAGQGGKEMADLKGLAIPVRVSGPFAALKYKLEYGSIVSDTAKQKLEEKKEIGIMDESSSRSCSVNPMNPRPRQASRRRAGPARQPKPEDKLKAKVEEAVLTPVSASAMKSFAERVIEWQRTSGRHDLPWQRTRDPYRIWLSEIMLQQTQVSAVVPYYARFLARFPDLASLAAAPEDDVLALWSGLGYYARARNLHSAARAIVERHAGAFPEAFDDIVALPGIGRSTAGAIAVFAFGARQPILDGNVKRVFARAFGIAGSPARRKSKRPCGRVPGLYCHRRMSKPIRRD